MTSGSLPSSIGEELKSTILWLAEDAAENLYSDLEEASYSAFQNAICRLITAIISGGDAAVRNLTAASLAEEYPLAADCEAFCKKPGHPTEDCRIAKRVRIQASKKLKGCSPGQGGSPATGPQVHQAPLFAACQVQYPADVASLEVSDIATVPTLPEDFTCQAVPLRKSG